jgi:hypothetical protein
MSLNLLLGEEVYTPIPLLYPWVEPNPIAEIRALTAGQIVSVQQKLETQAFAGQKNLMKIVPSLLTNILELGLKDKSLARSLNSGDRIWTLLCIIDLSYNGITQAMDEGGGYVVRIPIQSIEIPDTSQEFLSKFGIGINIGDIDVENKIANINLKNAPGITLGIRIPNGETEIHLIKREWWKLIETVNGETLSSEDRASLRNMKASVFQEINAFFSIFSAPPFTIPTPRGDATITELAVAAVETLIRG